MLKDVKYKYVQLLDKCITYYTYIEYMYSTYRVKLNSTLTNYVEYRAQAISLHLIYFVVASDNRLLHVCMYTYGDGDTNRRAGMGFCGHAPQREVTCI